MEEQDAVLFCDTPADRITKFISDWYQKWSEVSADIDFSLPRAESVLRHVLNRFCSKWPSSKFAHVVTLLR